MRGFQTQMSGNASAVVGSTLRNRLAAALLGVAGLVLAGCGPTSGVQVDSTPATIDAAGLNLALHQLSARARPGILGAGVVDLQTGESWAFNGDRRFPLTGLASLPIAAAVLAEVDAGRLDLSRTIEIADQDLSPPPSPVAQAWPRRRSYTLDALLTAATAGDATAADVVMKRIGGPGAVAGWLQSRRLEGIRVDRYARQVGCEMSGLASFRAAWAPETAFASALATVPEARRRAAQAAYLREPEDTATPNGVLAFLGELGRGEMLSRGSTDRLLTLMSRPGAGPERLRRGFPPGARMAHAAGTARADLGVEPAANEAGIITLPDGRRYGVVVLLAGAELDARSRDALFADVGKAVSRRLG